MPPAKAKGIHEHDRYKLGRRPPKKAPALRLGDVLTGVVPEHPATADHLGSLSFGLYGNDRFGDCGPTSVANLVRLVTGGLLGSEIRPSQDDVFDLYRRSGNPSFDPATGAGDDGVDMQTMLEALLSGGIGDGSGGTIKPVAFAKVDVSNDAEVDAAVSIFGGVLWGVTLQTAQQAQTDARPPVWDYKRTAIWGGHAVLDGAFTEVPSVDDVISWDMRVETTAEFRARQLEEAWVVVFPWNVDHPAFQDGVDLQKLADAYHELTGEALAIPAPPLPADVDATDAALWAEVGTWAEDLHHYGHARDAAAALRVWAKAKGLHS